MSAPQESWEVRRALRWGSETVAIKSSLKAALAFAAGDIEANGNVGRVEHVSDETRTVYYDIHEEMI